MHCLVRQRSIFLDVHNNCWWANLRLYYCHVWLTSFSHYDFSTVKNSLNSETVQQAFTIIYNSKISFTLFTDRIYEIHVSLCVCVSLSLSVCVCVCHCRWRNWYPQYTCWHLIRWACISPRKELTSTYLPGQLICECIW